MIATETFWRSPKSERYEGVREEMQRRVKLVEHLDEHPEDRADLMAYYQTDCIAWISDWVWTYDPRNRRPWSKRLPLILWDKQREMVEFILDLIASGDNGGIKKARDIGATYLMAAVADWLFLFERESTVTFGSRKEKLVDRRGDPKTIFYKIRDIFEHLPAWMMPVGWNPRVHDNILMIENPENHSVITGEAGDEMGRGGRSTVYFLDEFAFVSRAPTVDAAVNDNASTVIYVSTSNGPTTLFRAKEKSGHIRFFFHNWKHDPRKDEAWKEKKVREVGPTIFAQEHELDDEAAIDNVVIPSAWVHAAVELELAETRKITAGLDVADEGEDDNVLIIKRGPVVDWPECWQDVEDDDGARRRALPKDSARRALARCRLAGAALNYDRTGVGAGVAGVLHDEAWDVPHQGINNQSSPSEIFYGDDPDRSAKERFANAGTEMWWCMRRYFQCTYEHIEGIEEHPEDELISIPDDPVLISQLISRQYEITEKGKIRLESKKKLRSKGYKSPDRADALALACAPIQVVATVKSVVTAEYDPFDDLADF